MSASTHAKPPAVAPAVGKPAAPVKRHAASRMRKQMNALSVFWRAPFCLPMRQPGAVRRTLRLLETRPSDAGVTPATRTRRVAAALLGTPAPPPGRASACPVSQPSRFRGHRGTWVHRQSRATITRDSHPRPGPAPRPAQLPGRHQPAADHPAQGKAARPAILAGFLSASWSVFHPGYLLTPEYPPRAKPPGSGRSGPSGGLPD